MQKTHHIICNIIASVFKKMFANTSNKQSNESNRTAAISANDRVIDHTQKKKKEHIFWQKTTNKKNKKVAFIYKRTVHYSNNNNNYVREKKATAIIKMKEKVNRRSEKEPSCKKFTSLTLLHTNIHHNGGKYNELLFTMCNTHEKR